MISTVYVALACSRSFPGNVWVMVSTVHSAARAFWLPTEWISTPPVGQPGRRLPAECTWHIKCQGGTSPASRVDRAHLMPRWHITCHFDRQCASSVINAEDARPRGLMSGSTCWLTSQVAGYVVAAGLRLSGERWRTRYGPNTCWLRTPAWSLTRSGHFLSQNPGTLL
jgi:hypothetical protein